MGGNSQSGGRLMAVGDVNGTVSLLEVCESLAASQPNEKQAISGMFEREMKREKNLEAREREMRRKKKAFEDEKKKEAADKKDGKVDADFLQMIKEAEDDESKASEKQLVGGDGGK